MKTIKNLQFKTAFILMFSISATVLAVWSYSNYAYSSHNIISVLNVTVAIGMFGIVWYCLNIFNLFRKTVKYIKQGKIDNLKKSKNHMVRRLFHAVKKHTAVYVNYISELEEQLHNLQMKVRLLRTLKQNTDAIISQIPDAVIVIDEFDKLVMASKTAEKLFSFNLESSKHKPIDEIINTSRLAGQSLESQDKDNLVNLLRQVKKNMSHKIKREITLINKENDNNKIFDCSVSCICKGDGKFCGVVAILRDITHKKQVDRMRKDFVGHVSHELKTPLASIVAYSEILACNEVEDEQTKSQFYSVIQNQAQRLNQLIEDLLDTSRIESGMMKIKKQHFNMQKLMAEQLRMIENYAKQKRIEIIEPHKENTIMFSQVYADKNMIAQVVNNLLTNAIKYTKQGGTIKVNTDIDETENLARVTIADTGIGIAEDELIHIFDKYYRISTNGSDEKGSGLGLNLVKQIVEKLHSGRVFVSSTPGVGSIFGFELPLDKTDKIVQLQSV